MLILASHQYGKNKYFNNNDKCSKCSYTHAARNCNKIINFVLNVQAKIVLPRFKQKNVYIVDVYLIICLFTL